MGEVVTSSTQELEVKIESETHKEKRAKYKKKKEEEEEEETESGRVGEKKRNDVSSDGLLVRWEKLFPKMVLRVLLVEADDSTRQIIAALLRKCSYRVATVPDGLKAWEILKARPHNIDLILTEVDLPLISGYALLTLIMEHEICKNIPVIMMSSQDSVSTVYKCMLRGAADYLVKPIRRNELRNLWQHVWRRQSSLVGGNSPQDESVGQDKVEETSENNAASNHSSGDMACMRRSKECIEKGSDAQSSCTKPDLGAERAQVENMQDFLQPIWGEFLLNNLKMQKNGLHTNLDEKLLLHENETAAAHACKDANTMTVDKDVVPQCRPMNANVTHEASDNNDILVNSSMEAIDFMGASINQNFCLDHVRNKFDSYPHLDLSLRRSHPGGFEIQTTEERHTLRHSNASAFTRYANRPLQPPHSTLASVCEQKELGTNSERNLSGNACGYNSDAPGLAQSTQRSTISLATNQTKESEYATSCSQQKIFPIQIPVKGIRFNNLCTSYSSVFPPIFCKQSGASPTPSPSSASHPEPASKVNLLRQSSFESKSEQLYDQFGQDANDSTNRTLQKQDHGLACLEDRGQISPATDQSATSSFCNGAVSHLNSLGYGSTSGSNSNADQVAVARAVPESRNEGVFTHNTNSHRSVQREAALNKFRLKRKDRCYEKKVRYESRKKLAEQRPRVKGQFVRQLHIDPAPGETDC